MTLRTILFFALAGLLVSVPLLFSRARPGSGPDAEWNNRQAMSGSTADGFFSQRWDDGQSAAGEDPGPFQLAGSSGNPGSDQSVPGHFASSSGNAAWSEPVYFAFAGPNEFLRFDLSPEWIRNRWPAVSVFQASDGLTGMRVPLVSGPRPQDIHGSLTYFLDSQQQIQRIGFRGWTGDPAELVNFLQSQGYVRVTSNGAGLFRRTSWGRNKGTLRLDHPPLKQSNTTTEQYMLLLEMVNPASSLNVSSETQTILDAMEDQQ
jgi:hypothetical protein